MSYQKFTASSHQPFDSLGLFTYLRTYARRHDESNPQSSIESWQECLTRVVNACNTQLGVGFTESEKQEFFDLLYNLKCSVAGRFLWQLGTRTVDKLGLMSLQNCAFTVIDSPVKPFTWIMNFLMLGAGCGYRISQSDIDKFPTVKRAEIVRRDDKDSDFIVPDTRQGWIKLLGKVMKAHFYSGEGFTYSCHLLRSKGAPIKGFGGLSSGPEVLCDGIAKINDLLNAKAGLKITSVDALDIANIIGMIVVSGNVRRSAQIALGDATDAEYMKAKRWDLGSIPNWRCYSNNSVICNDIKDIIDNEDFWAGYNGNGEPYGLVNLRLSQSCGRLGEIQYADPNVEGYNPCVTSDTWVMTEQGPRMVRDLVDKGKVNVYVHGKLYETTDRGFFATRVAQVYTLKTREGYTLRATGNHNIMTPDGWVPLENLKEDDKVLIHCHENLSWGGDGTVEEGFDSGIDATSDIELPCSQSLFYYNVEKSSSEFCRGFLKAVFASRGFVSKLLGGILIFSNNHELRSTIQRILNRFGIYSSTEVIKNTFLVIKQSQAFMKLIENNEMDYKAVAHMGMATVKNIVADGVEPVFDCTVPAVGRFDANSFVVSNCAEQSLARWETCCLGEIYLPNINTFDELKKCVTYIYRTCKHSLALPCVDSKETENIVHQHFRMGIGITGYLQATEEQRNWLKDCYTYLRTYDKEYSASKNFPESIKLTTCKPSGTLSILGHCTSGVHPGFAQYYIRRIRVSSESKLIGVAKAHGYHVEYVQNFDGSFDYNTQVISFPYALPEGTILAENCTAVQQLEYVKRLQTEWSDNAVSVTVYYRSEELPEIKEWLRKNYNDYVKTVSFLLHSDHGFKQAPLEKITKEQYEEMVKTTRPITNVGDICYSSEDENFIGEGECAGGACPLK